MKSLGRQIHEERLPFVLWRNPSASEITSKKSHQFPVFLQRNTEVNPFNVRKFTVDGPIPTGQ